MYIYACRRGRLLKLHASSVRPPSVLRLGFYADGSHLPSLPINAYDPNIV